MEISIEQIETAITRIGDILTASMTRIDWVAVLIPSIISLISIFFAIYVPYKIMNKQNMIALFDKRFKIYEQIIGIFKYIEHIKQLKTLPNNPNPSSIEMASTAYSLWCNQNQKLSVAYDARINNKVDTIKIFNLIKISYDVLAEQMNLLESSQFLFDNDVSSMILELAKKYEEYIDLIISSFITNNIQEQKYEKIKNELYSCTDNKSCILSKMCQSLKLI